MSKNRFIIGTVLGAVGGVVAGILTAPKSGQETREEIKAKAAELKEETARRAQAAKDAKKPIDSLKQQAEQIVTRGKDSLKGDSHKEQ